MGQFLRVNGDYSVRAGDGAKITLDTGPAASGGSVRAYASNAYSQKQVATENSKDYENRRDAINSNFSTAI
jgi:hypothetical protein